MAELPERSFLAETRAEWRAWLAEHHMESQGVWLVTYKKSSGRPHLEYEAVVEECICFGWIDSVIRGLDAERSMLYIAPRKPKTGWSKSNKGRVARLEALGLLTEPGITKIEAAKADGSWSKLDTVELLEVPTDLEAAFDQFPGSRENWHAFPKSVRRGILEWLVNAKRPETRAKRVEETARLAADNIRANQWTPKS